MKFSNKYLLLLSFIEGGSVMACELIGAKLLAPKFGTSLYVWAAALGLTLGGLTFGYFMGGRLSRRYPNNYNILFNILSIAGVLLIIMPFTSQIVMNQLIDLSLELGAILSLAIFMLPPLIFMGMTSPLIINLLTQDPNNAGKNAGNVYAISTLGGILYTFLLGFVLIPNFGLTGPAIVSGLILTCFACFGLLKSKFIIPIVLSLVMSTFLSSKPKQIYNDEYKVLYQSEGILGQVKVVDYPSYEITTDNQIGRALIVNNTLQTYVGLNHDLQYSIWQWSHYFPTAASIFSEGSDVLLLGLGGGTIVKQLNTLNFNVDVVEIDERIWEVSTQFFNLDKNTNIFIDDARHYINTCKKKYDIIIYDTFLSESVPEHLLTIEGFNDAKKILKDDGMIMSNFYGFIKGEKGRAARSVYKTFEEAGFLVDILSTPGAEQNRNLIFLASQKEQDFTLINYEEPNYKKIENIYDHFIDPRSLDLSDAYVLSDFKPRLSKLYNPAAKEWKKSYNQYFHKNFAIKR